MPSAGSLAAGGVRVIRRRKAAVRRTVNQIDNIAAWLIERRLAHRSHRNVNSDAGWHLPHSSADNAPERSVADQSPSLWLQMRRGIIAVQSQLHKPLDRMISIDRLPNKTMGPRRHPPNPRRGQCLAVSKKQPRRHC